MGTFGGDTMKDKTNPYYQKKNWVAVMVVIAIATIIYFIQI